MKHIITIIAAIALCVAPSCSLTPEQQAKVMAFTDLGVQAFVDNGTLKPGTSILIKEGVGLITSFNAPAKEVPLTQVGLAEAVQTGTVAPGDTVMIREATAVVVPPSTAPPPGN
jgi:hypothetical protein